MDFQSRQHSGFTFVEIIASVVVLGLLATPLLIGQYQIITRIMPASSLLEHIFFIENALVDQLSILTTQKNLKDSKSVEKTLVTPAMKVRSELIDMKSRQIVDKSSLKNFKDIQLVKTQGSWIFAGTEQREILVTFAYKQTPTGESAS